MAINLSNVNISIQKFQEISSGKYNAGEVKLTSETSIDKVNNHVTMKFLNTTKISHVEVLAIKNAFVKALKGGGVDADELNRIRQELGLAPEKPVDKTLHERSIKPLSRQQIREILDRNAAAINQHEGAGTIRTSQEIHAGTSERTLASRAADRNQTNAQLNTRRDIIENKEINKIQAVLAGDVDFVPFAERKGLLEMARRCLDIALADCQGRPRDDFRPAIHWRAPGGKEVALSTGLTEKALIRKLEDIIVRLAMDKAPSREELAIRNEFKALATPEARAAWAANLANDPQGAFKARVVAVMIMHDRGIDDAATLSVVNRLKNDAAIAFAANLVTGGMNLEGDALRASAPVETALADVDPDADISEIKSAYIPALTDQEFNKEICSKMTGSGGHGFDELPATFQKLIIDASCEVRGRYGSVGFPDGANHSYLTTGTELWNMIDVDNPNAQRVSPESLRDNYINGAIKAGAMRVIDQGVKDRLKAAGIEVKSPMSVANAIRAREVAILQRICQTDSLQAANAVLDEYTDLIVALGKKTAACERCKQSVGDWARAALAEILGVPAASLAGGMLVTNGLTGKVSALINAIGAGTNPANSEAEVEAEFRKLVNKFVDERVQVFAKIDAADLNAEAKIAFKTAILGMDKVNYLDIEAMIASAKAISAANLAGLLADNAPKARIFEAMQGVTIAVSAAMNRMFEAARKAGKEIGVDEQSNFIDPMIKMVVLSQPGLADMLAQFLASPAMDGEELYSLEAPHPAQNFMVFKPEPGANEKLASKLGTDAFPAFHTKALVEAVREEGLGELTAAETLALFKPGQPAHKQLKTFIETAERPISAPQLGVMARAALRNCKATILAERQNKAAVGTAERAFLAGDGARRALAAGYHQSELPRLAKAFALYKVAANAIDEDALAAVLDPASKASRLVGYGGRFTESAESFRSGLALMDKFAAWYANLSADVRSGTLDTPTKVNAGKGFVYPNGVKGYEMFVFQDLAIRPDVNLDEPDSEKLFGVEHNDAVNFFVRGNGAGCTGTLVKLSPAKRQVVFAAFKAIEPPVAENPNQNITNVYNNAGYLARILRHFDEVANLQAAGKLDRAHLNAILTPDLGLPPDASSQQVSEAIQSRMYAQYADSPGKLMEVGSILTESGYTITEAMNAVANGQKPAALDDISSTQMAIEQIDGTTNGGREFMLGDLCRPSNVAYAGSGQPVIPAENCHFTVKIGGETIQCVMGSKNLAANAHIADKIENLCGKVHIEQANTVMRGLAQGAHSAILPILSQNGIVNGIGAEHMALTYTLTKNDETGAVTIHYSEPAGFPFKFSWETTVAIDGTSTTTPVVVAKNEIPEPPPAPAPVPPPAPAPVPEINGQRISGTNMPKITNQQEFEDFFFSLDTKTQFGSVSEDGKQPDALGNEKRTFVYSGIVFRGDDRKISHPTMTTGFTSRNDLTKIENKIEAMGLGVKGQDDKGKDIVAGPGATGWSGVSCAKTIDGAISYLDAGKTFYVIDTTKIPKDEKAWDMENTILQNKFKETDESNGEVNVSYIPRNAIIGWVNIPLGTQGRALGNAPDSADKLAKLKNIATGSLGSFAKLTFNPEYKA